MRWHFVSLGNKGTLSPAIKLSAITYTLRWALSVLERSGRLQAEHHVLRHVSATHWPQLLTVFSMNGWQTGHEEAREKKMTHPDTPDLTIRELVWEAEIKQRTVRYSRGRPRLSAVPPSRRKEGCIHRDHQSPCWVTNACSLLQRKWLSLNSDSELCRHWVIFLSSLLSYVLA